MVTSTEDAAGAAAPAPRVWRNVPILSLGQALFVSGMSIQISVGGLVGYGLAEDKGTATLPVAATVVGTALFTIPAAFFMRRFGRRAGFILGGVFGTFSALLSAYAVNEGMFWLFVFSSLLFGAFNASAQYYRFAAVDGAPERVRARAISFVMAGGVIAAFAGPEIAKHPRALFEPVLYLGAYLAVAVISVLACGLLFFLRIPPLTAAQRAETGRPLSQIMAQPAFIAAVVSAVVGYATMSFLMTATPLAMQVCGFAFDPTATVIQFHVLAMFLPSFVTGTLIDRFGVRSIIITGGVLNLAGILCGWSGITWWNFWANLVLLGIGWNFMFIGGTTLLTRTYTVAERAKSQAANDFLVFGGMAIASLFSGKVLYEFGWETVVLVAIPAVLVAILVVALFGGRRPVLTE